MKRAMLMLLDQSRKQREADALAAGLAAHGRTVSRSIQDPRAGDVLIVWNRMGHHNAQAKLFERCGARVIVAENGYLGAEWRGQRWMALSVGHHNGAGYWRAGGPERWDSWDVDLAPMRRPGGPTLLLAQRGIGEPALRAPERWTSDMSRRFMARIRRHPGTHIGVPLEDDLKGASAVVTWSSGAALRAMLLGLHCWHGMPGWIGAPASTHVGAQALDTSDRRLPMLRRLAWAMWTEQEVAAGAAFEGLLC